MNINSNGEAPINPINNVYNGLTKREYFAALAMQGIMANEFLIRDKTDKGVAIRALSLADNLLKELEK